MNVASMMARMRNSRLLAEAKAPSATMTQAMVNSRPRRVTCWRMPRSSEEWRRDQMRSTLYENTRNPRGVSLRLSLRRNEVRPADCKPVSVPGKGRWPFIWAKHLCLALATYPRVERSGQLLPSYLVLLRMGFTLPARITPAAVRSYRTFSPLPPTPTRSPRPGGIFSVALSVKLALSEPPRPLAGMLPCGDRTFLPAGEPKLTPERPPVYRPTFIVAAYLGCDSILRAPPMMSVIA